MDKKVIIGLLIALVISIFVNGSLYLKAKEFSAASGQAFYQTVSFLQGFAGGGRDQFGVNNVGVLSSSANATFADLTLSGRDLTVTTSNSSTSTIEVGCIQMYATSTATPVNMQFHASSSLADSTNGTSDGLVVWLYGTCAI